MSSQLLQEYRGEIGKGRTVDDIVGWVEHLPPMPDVILRGLRLMDDLNTTPEQLAEVLMRDPALASPILRVANSAKLGHQHEIKTLATAILVVGMGEIKSILVASALKRWSGFFGPVERLVWEKSIATAVAARVLCEQLRKVYRDEVYLAALLHNLGQIVLLSDKEIGRDYPLVLDRIREHDENLVTAEQAVLGYSHPLIGALVAWKWGFPHTTCRIILHYTDPLEGVFGEQDEKLAIVKLSAEIGLALGFGKPERHPVETKKELEALAMLVGLNPTLSETDLDTAMAEIKSRVTTEIGAFA